MATTTTELPEQPPEASDDVAPVVAPPPGHPRFPLFDGLRAIAALGVLVAHAASIAASPNKPAGVSGAVLANAGVFMVVALKAISQLDPTRLQFILDWGLFALVSLLPLAIGLGLLLLAPRWTGSRLSSVRGRVERHARTIALVVMAGLAISLLRDGISGLTS